MRSLEQELPKSSSGSPPAHPPQKDVRREISIRNELVCGNDVKYLEKNNKVKTNSHQGRTTFGKRNSATKSSSKSPKNTKIYHKKTFKFFASNAKTFYREIKEEKITVEEPTMMEGVDNFWENIWT